MRSATFSAPPFAGRPQRARHALARCLRPPRCGLCFPVFFQQYESGALRKEGAPIHTFCVVLTNTAASMTTPGAAAAKAAAATAAGTAETATAAAEASSAAKAAASKSAAAARRPGRARAGDAAPAGAAGPYGGDDGRPSYCPGKSPCRTKGRCNKCCNGRRAGGAAR